MISVSTLEIATLVGSDQLARPSRASLLWSISSRTSRASDDAAALELVNVLGFGKQAHDKEIIGAAYYAMMCRGRKWWAFHSGVDDSDRRRLAEGMMRCAEEWHEIQINWAVNGFGCHLKCAQNRDVLDASLKIQAERDLAWYDVIGKIDATLWGNFALKNNPCKAQITDTVGDVLYRIKSELYDYFTDKFY